MMVECKEEPAFLLVYQSRKVKVYLLTHQHPGQTFGPSLSLNCSEVSNNLRTDLEFH